MAKFRPERVGMWPTVDDEGVETRVRREKGSVISNDLHNQRDRKPMKLQIMSSMIVRVML